MLISKLTNNLAKSIRSLQTKKARHSTGLFLVEGLKPVVEVLQSGWQVETLCATPEFFASHQQIIQQAQQTANNLGNQALQLIEASPKQLANLGSLVTNNAAIAVVKQQATAATNSLFTPNKWLLAVDGINDPGNLGSLLRIADWFGIKQIICSPNSVEVYNPKVIAASKGSFLRVAVSYQPLIEVLPALAAANSNNSNKLPLVGALLNGSPLPQLANQLKHQSQGILVLGSEANGLSQEVEALLTHKLTIPRLGQAESLNLGVAAGIICAALFLD